MVCVQSSGMELAIPVLSPASEAQSNDCGSLIPGRTIGMMAVFPAANCSYTEHRQIRPCVLMQLNKLFGESHTSQ